MSQELRERAEKVIEWYETVKHHGAGWGEMAETIVAVARNYLAEHPADDAEPATPERLRAEGWDIHNYPIIWACKTVSGIGVMVDFFPNGEVVAKVGGLEWQTNPSLGSLRRLLKALEPQKD